MRVLLVHNEKRYYGGAERMLEHFIAELRGTSCEAVVACAPESDLSARIATQTATFALDQEAGFSLPGLFRQARQIARFHAEFPFDVAHGWAVRDWELAALAGRFSRRPAIGTLHDHPRASFLSRKRQALMKLTARWALVRVICVSEAVRRACEEATYPAAKLLVIHNGLPVGAFAPPAQSRHKPVLRIGFLGVVSERKGIRGCFEMLSQLSKATSGRWEFHLAGGSQGVGGEVLIESIRKEYGGAPWWNRVLWRGWVDRPGEFLSELDLLIVPSTEFDPFPTVLLEAGSAGVPVLAARVGGVPEIVEDQRTGWLFDPGNWSQATAILEGFIRDPDRLQTAGEAARKRVQTEFCGRKMVAKYLDLYSSIGAYV